MSFSNANWYNCYQSYFGVLSVPVGRTDSVDLYDKYIHVFTLSVLKTSRIHVIFYYFARKPSKVTPITKKPISRSADSTKLIKEEGAEDGEVSADVSIEDLLPEAGISGRDK